MLDILWGYRLNQLCLRSVRLLAARLRFSTCGQFCDIPCPISDTLAKILRSSVNPFDILSGEILSWIDIGFSDDQSRTGVPFFEAAEVQLNRNCGRGPDASDCTSIWNVRLLLGTIPE